MNNLLYYLPISESLFKKETAADDKFNELGKHVQNGWPATKEEVPTIISQYWNFRDEITIIDGLLFKAHKLVVPKTLQASMLELIHEAHPSKCVKVELEKCCYFG